MKKFVVYDLISLFGLIFFFIAFVAVLILNPESTRLELIIITTFGMLLSLILHLDTKLNRVIDFFEIGFKEDTDNKLEDLVDPQGSLP